MPPIGDGTETVSAEAAADTTTASPAGTETGSPSSGEAVVETPAIDRIEDAFLEKFGIKEDETPAVVEPQADTPPADEPPAGAEGEAQTSEATTEQQPDAGDASTRLTNDEFKALPPKAQKRMGFLTDRARRAEGAKDQALAQVNEFREGHEAITALRSYASERGLRPEDVSASLNIAGLIQQGKFGEFLEAVMPWVTTAMEATGQALAPEIEQMVENGDITREAGLRMTKTEREAELAQQRAEAAQAANRTRSESDARTAAVEAIKGSVIATEASLRASDPDWALKAPAIKAQFKMMLENGARPATPEAAAEMLKDIHAGVMVVPKPRLQATNRAPDATPVDRHAAPPKNTLELIERTWDSKFGARA